MSQRLVQVRAIAEERRHLSGPLLPILHAVVEELGYVADDDIAVLAHVLNLSRAEVLGVISFYADFRRTPPAEHRIDVCRGEACQSVGGDAVLAATQHRYAGRNDVEVGTVFCLGLCAAGPSAMVDGRPITDVDAEAGVVSAVSAVASAPPAAPAAPAVPPSDGSIGLVAAPVAQPAGADPQRHITAYVPADSFAVARGADAVAAALAQHPEVSVVRTGSRGMAWLEPLVEIDRGNGRVGYGATAPQDVPAILAGAHPDLGPMADHPWLRSQHRVTFARVGVVDPGSLSDYREHGGLRGLARALTLDPGQVCAEVVAAGLRGRGGAGFPTGVKWQTVLSAASDVKYVCANADEGDSGTYADRMLIEGDPFALIEGMLIAGHAVDAQHGFVYVRSEYPRAIEVLRHAIAVAEGDGLLGPDGLGPGRPFVIDVRVGAGAYICGEETSMLESIEGRRGEVRAKPPIPALSGLFGQPTVVNNVITLATVPALLTEGGATAYAALGSGRSRGTSVFQLGGNVSTGGIVEVPFGLTLRELVEGYGGGTRTGRALKAVQVGGPLGAYLPAAALDVPMDYEELAAAGGLLGHGGIVVYDDTADMGAMARFAMEFCAAESCGKCTPCRIGSTRGVEVIDRIRHGVNPTADLALLEDLCETMTKGSLCAMGGLTPLPVRSCLQHFPEDFGLEPAAQEVAP